MNIFQHGEEKGGSISDAYGRHWGEGKVTQLMSGNLGGSDKKIKGGYRWNQSDAQSRTA